MRILALILMLLLVPVARGLAQGESVGTIDFESVDARIGFARAAFLYGDYVTVIEVLEPEFLPVAPELPPETLVTAYTWLGVAAYYESQTDIAMRAFRNILFMRPTHELDPSVWPSDVVAYFEEVRAAHSDVIDVPDEEDELPPGTTVYIESRYREQSLWVSVLPFGYGFLTSGRDVIGTSYLFGQALLATTSVSLGIAHELARDNEGWVENAGRQRRIATAASATGIAFVVLAIVNAVHGATTHNDVSSIEYRVLDAPPEELGVPTSRAWRFSFTPILDF